GQAEISRSQLFGLFNGLPEQLGGLGVVVLLGRLPTRIVFGSPKCFLPVDGQGPGNHPSQRYEPNCSLDLHRHGLSNMASLERNFPIVNQATHMMPGASARYSARYAQSLDK